MLGFQQIMLEWNTIQPIASAFTLMLGKCNLILEILGTYTVRYPVRKQWVVIVFTEVVVLRGNQCRRKW